MHQHHGAGDNTGAPPSYAASPSRARPVVSPLARFWRGGGGSNEKVRFQVIRKDPASRGTEESAAVLVAVQA